MRRDDVLTCAAASQGPSRTSPSAAVLPYSKSQDRMFALVTLDDDPGRVNLKCDPDLALELRDRFPAVMPGYHANKRHWNTVELDGSIGSDELEEMIEHSYELVVSKLSRAARARLSGD